MEITNDLLVVIMYVVLITIGIGNIVMTLSAIINRPPSVKLYWVHSSWMLLLLLVYFNLFWHTLSLFEVEGWQFGGFLYIVTGPLLILFATQVILPELSDAGEFRDFYFRVSRKFFLFMAALQLWIIGTDIVLGTGFQTISTFNAVFCVIALGLASTQQPKMHAAGAGVAWVLFLTVLGLRALGVIA